MRIAVLSDCYLPRLGGIENQTHDLALRLAARGHQVEVFTTTPADGRDGPVVPAGAGAVRVHRLALGLPAGVPVNPWAGRMLRHRLGQFDVAHVQMGVVSPFAYQATAAAVQLGLPTVMTWHCMFGAAGPVFRLAPVMRSWAGSGVAMNAVSETVRRQLADLLAGAGPVRVLPNGIDVSAWRPPAGPSVPEADGIRPRRGTAAGVRRVTVVSAMRLARRKRPVALLRMMSRVRRCLPARQDVHLEVIGEGPLRPVLERWTHRTGMDAWVNLVGRQSREEVSRRLVASDIYVAPSRTESFGIAALEARTAGLPVVGRYDGGVADFVTDGVNGFLAGDDASMAAAIIRLVTDEVLRERIHHHNAYTPPAQAWEHVLPLAEGEYDRAVALAGRGRGR